MGEESAGKFAGDSCDANLHFAAVSVLPNYFS
jgi:hypothetical protein